MTFNQFTSSHPLTLPCSKSQRAKRFSVLRTSIKVLCLLSLTNFSFASEPQTNPVNSQINSDAVEKAPALASNTASWYQVRHSNTVTFKTAYGDVVIALHPSLAPKHVARFKSLIDAGFYNEQAFYRVVDGFVAQAGSNDTHDASKFPPTLFKPINAEFTQPLNSNVNVVESKDMFAPNTGFLDGFPVGIDQSRKEMWGLHCPGVVAFARNSEKDTASTEFYIVIGQAPRHLDRNMSVVGRVLQGMDVLQKLPRGNMDRGGVLDDITQESKIKQAFVHANNATPYFLQTPHHEEYKKRANTGRNLDNPFFHDNTYGPRPIDVCYYQTKTSNKAW
ncbi:peptidylprolyl isomerase [Alteromonas macleodii]|uniref:peptidylprolyl isomerase n=1 Tax=Alteromonas macleodii TaxID=28108 RepID=UPI00066A961B|nr:peptidylprolyl isomerase [Alteromonas macleodii]CAI3947726.1 Peptidyl-prolyl cis-trans isomerase (rotamase) -cyclophilin family [Alteromonas macleodii]VTP51638.1 Peptidyl-prolyl cis-trans isomerase (rotamase) -cyclophilin family [Alteromonas macleodii]